MLSVFPERFLVLPEDIVSRVCDQRTSRRLLFEKSEEIRQSSNKLRGRTRRLGNNPTMGVPKFYRWLSERYPCLSEVVKEHQIPEFDNLYLDMNGIIHVCSHPNDDDPHFRISEEQIFKSIFHYIEVLFRMIQPRKTFLMAVDGVAPRKDLSQSFNLLSGFLISEP